MSGFGTSLISSLPEYHRISSHGRPIGSSSSNIKLDSYMRTLRATTLISQAVPNPSLGQFWGAVPNGCPFRTAVWKASTMVSGVFQLPYSPLRLGIPSSVMDKVVSRSPTEAMTFVIQIGPLASTPA
ncbi:hypothetical protein [Streptomyces anulatus]|uniref:hypothetical protein n=1 Tax=Streptomyces anulatus TaxID=1892 RepID=UPI00365A775F